MNKIFFAISAAVSVALCSPVQAYYYDYYYPIVRVEPRYPRNVMRVYTDYPVTVVTPEDMLMSLGTVAGFSAVVLGLCGMGEIVQSMNDCPGNDGAELPRGVVMLTTAACIGAVAIAALRSAIR